MIVGHQLVKVRLRKVESRYGCDLQGGGGADGQKVVHGPHGGGQVCRRDHESQPPAGDGKGLAQAADGYGALSQRLQAARKAVLAPIVENAVIDLVRDQHQVVLEHHVGHAGDLLGVKDATGRIVGGIEYQRSRARGDGPVQLFCIQPVVWRFQRQGHRLGPGKDGRRDIVLVGRLNDQHLVAGIQQGQQRCVHRFCHATGDGDVFGRIDFPAQPLGVHFGQFLAQGGVAPGRRVLVVAVVDRLGGGFLEGERRIKVGESLAQVDGVVLHGQPGHLADDGFLKA